MKTKWMKRLKNKKKAPDLPNKDYHNYQIHLVLEGHLKTDAPQIQCLRWWLESSIELSSMIMTSAVFVSRSLRVMTVWHLYHVIFVTTSTQSALRNGARSRSSARSVILPSLWLNLLNTTKGTVSFENLKEKIRCVRPLNLVKMNRPYWMILVPLK